MEGLMLVVVVGGPILLGIALIVALRGTAKRNKRVDPATPSDDPSKGMPGHDRTPKP